MHAENRHLIALRDREPVDAAIAAHVRDCVTCRRRLAETGALRDALRGLPDEMPPAGAWQRVVALRAGQSRSRSRKRWPAAVAACALALVAAGIFLELDNAPPEGSDAEPGMRLADLQQRSRELEYALQHYRPRTLVSLQTAELVSELEDSIALIDYQLTAGNVEGRQRRELWEQRVSLMQSLLAVQSAEYYADSI